MKEIYKILSGGDDEELAKEVAEHLAQGYEPAGGPTAYWSVFRQEYTAMCQAVWLPDDKR